MDTEFAERFEQAIRLRPDLLRGNKPNQSQVGKLMKAKRQTAGQWLSGKVEISRLSPLYVARFCEAVGVRPVWLLTGEGVMRVSTASSAPDIAKLWYALPKALRKHYAALMAFHAEGGDEVRLDVAKLLTADMFLADDPRYKALKADFEDDMERRTGRRPKPKP